jgi:capsid assembly protease
VREPVRLSSSLLATYRPCALVAVALGLLASIPAHRPQGYKIHALAAGGGELQWDDEARAGAAPGTAVLEIRGVLEQRANAWSCGETCGYDEIEERFISACFDPGVGQIVLDVDSPGGDVPGLEQAIARMVAAKVASGKPVLGYANELIASAALWLTLGVVDALYLPPSGEVGAVGSVVAFESEARKLADEGRDIYIARDPPGKMVPNSMEPLDDLGKARLDKRVKDATARFVAHVARMRGVDPVALRGQNGALFTGSEALAAGLADGIAENGLHDVIALAEGLRNA